MKNLKERFLKYVSIDTQSDSTSDTYPSTKKQFDLLNLLHDEIKALGLHDVSIDDYGYVMGTIPASKGCESAPVIGFIAHVDTSPDLSGANVKPQIIENYDGERIVLNENISMGPEEFPNLALLKGHTIITTDGTTLLGADDKAGVAEIVTAAEYLMSHTELKHGAIRIGFTPDEEIGRGVDYFDVEKFGAKFAYTMDGSVEGELEYENFNAAAAKIEIQGSNIHPGEAKNKMLNAFQIAMELNNMLPPTERPEHTEHYEGFFHLMNIQGSVECATMEYIIRDHDKIKFNNRMQQMENIAAYLNTKYGKEVIKLTLTIQYLNMLEMVEPHPEIIAKAEKAMLAAGVTPIIKPIRGGTDGSRLSYMGLPCPNVFAGGMNFHGKYELCSLNTMEKAVKTIINITQEWVK